MGASFTLGVRTVVRGWLVYNVIGSVLALGRVGAGGVGTGPLWSLFQPDLTFVPACPKDNLGLNAQIKMPNI